MNGVELFCVYTPGKGNLTPASPRQSVPSPPFGPKTLFRNSWEPPDRIGNWERVWVVEHAVQIRARKFLLRAFPITQGYTGQVLQRSIAGLCDSELRRYADRRFQVISHGVG